MKEMVAENTHLGYFAVMSRGGEKYQRISREGKQFVETTAPDWKSYDALHRPPGIIRIHRKMAKIFEGVELVHVQPPGGASPGFSVPVCTVEKIEYDDEQSPMSGYVTLKSRKIIEFVQDQK